MKGDTSGEFEDFLVALITPPAAYDCHEVMRAMKVGFPAIFFLQFFSLSSFSKITFRNEEKYYVTYMNKSQIVE